MWAAITAERPDLCWITQHEPLPVLPTPVIRYRSTDRMVLNKADYSTRGIYPLCPNRGKTVLSPQPLKSCRIGGGVLDGMLNILVSQIILNQPGVGALVG